MPNVNFSLETTGVPFYTGILQLPWYWQYFVPVHVAKPVPTAVLAAITASRPSSGGELLFFRRDAKLFSHCICGLVNAKGRLVAIYHFRHDHASRN